MVNTDEPPRVPGTRLKGESAQLVLMGSPKQESAMELWKGPPSEVRFIAIELEVPRTTVNEGAAGETEKSEPVPLRLSPTVVCIVNPAGFERMNAGNA